MPNPKGSNAGVVGKKGRSGRKGAGVEWNNQQILQEMFFTEIGKEEILKKLKTGKYSLKDVFVQKGYSGNERILTALFNKVFPDEKPANPVNVFLIGRILQELEQSPIRKKITGQELPTPNLLPNSGQTRAADIIPKE